MASGQSVLVVDQSQAGGRRVAPPPQLEIEIILPSAWGEASHEQTITACADEAARKCLCLRLAIASHLVAPTEVGEGGRGHPLGLERRNIPRIEDVFDVGVVADQRRWLEAAGAVGFPQRRQNGQRRVERGKALWVEAPAIKLRAPAR